MLRARLMALGIVGVFLFSCELQARERPRREQQQQASDRVFGFGIQDSFPAFGLSAIYNATDHVGVEGIVGLFGDLKIFAGKGIYRLRNTDTHNVYAYGLAGMWRYSGYNSVESTLGLGGGFGIEYYPSFIDGLSTNVELGLARASFNEVDYSLSTITLGFGIHYYP